MHPLFEIDLDRPLNHSETMKLLALKRAGLLIVNGETIRGLWIEQDTYYVNPMLFRSSAEVLARRKLRAILAEAALTC